MRSSWCTRIVELDTGNPVRGEGDPMWLDRYSVACQECADLVAVYEAPDRRIALLLRQPLVPLPEELPSLRRATRSAVRMVTGKLRAAGLHGGFMVLQWQPLGIVGAL